MSNLAFKEAELTFRAVNAPRQESIIEPAPHPESEELRNAINGSVVGSLIGVLNGIATLMVIGADFIPGIIGVALIVGFSALGGAMFGAIIGSTGMFAGVLSK